jgi:hypothetical protein
LAKDWYRIEKGAVHPQRIIFYGPLLGIVGFILPVALGIIAVLCCDKIIPKSGPKLFAPDVSAS